MTELPESRAAVSVIALEVGRYAMIEELSLVQHAVAYVVDEPRPAVMMVLLKSGTSLYQ
jgi:hypothetical protein